MKTKTPFIFLSCFLNLLYFSFSGSAQTACIDASYTDTWSYPTPQLYMFSGTQYARYDITTRKVESANKIATGFAGVPFAKFDACYVDTWSYPTPQLYIFSGTKYARYDILLKKFEGMNDIAIGFAGIPFPTIDACYTDTWSYPTPQLYVFSGTQYARYDLLSKRFEGTNTIASGFPGNSFPTFDACYTDTWSYATPQLYVFNGTQYARFSIKPFKFETTNNITDGYPNIPFCNSKGSNKSKIKAVMKSHQ